MLKPQTDYRLGYGFIEIANRLSNGHEPHRPRDQRKETYLKVGSINFGREEALSIHQNGRFLSIWFIHVNTCLSESTNTKQNLTLSQANQFSIDILNGGQTDPSALLDPSDHDSSHEHVPSAVRLPIQNAAPTLNATPSDHTKLENKPNSLFTGHTSTAASKQVQRQPLFQSFGRHSPTQAEVENAEEMDYEDLPQIGHMAEQVDMSDTHLSALFQPLADFDYEAAVCNSSLFTKGEIDREEAIRTSARFTDQYNTMTNHALCAHPLDPSCSQLNQHTEAHGSERRDRMVTDEYIETFEQETGGDVTEQEMWEIFNDGEVDEGGDEDKENLAPFNGLVRRRSVG
ncbi:MAG: hypothetical protein Q9180_002692 [Flavoplaca navasiana]